MRMFEESWRSQGIDDVFHGSRGCGIIRGSKDYLAGFQKGVVMLVSGDVYNYYSAAQQ